MALEKTIPDGSPYNPTNSDIGDTSNYDVSEGTFDVSNITMTEIRDVLGESTHKLSELCQSPNINQWALFKPDGSSPYSMGDFGGYNHTANPTTYFYEEPKDGTYPINYSSSEDSYSVGFGYILKRGELPPTGSKDWDRVRIKATVSGDSAIDGDYYSDVQSASDGYDNITVSIPLPDGEDRNVDITFTGEYVSSSDNYIDDIEDSSYTIEALLTYEITYEDAPSEVEDNSFEPEFKHYYTQRVGSTNPTITTEVEDGTVGDIKLEDTSTPITGIVASDSFTDDVSEDDYAYYYEYSVIRNGDGSIYYKLNLKEHFRDVGFEYQTDESDPYDNWYKVNDISSGYEFWFVNDVDNDIEELSNWPTV